MRIALARKSESRHGVFTRAQAVACGCTPDEINRRLASGLWIAVHRGVFRVAGAPLSFDGRVLAAVLACGPRAYASHETAAMLWELEDISCSEIHVTVAGRRRVRRPGVVVHRPVALSKRDVTMIGVIPITSPARTIVDLAGRTDPSRLEDVLDDAIRRGLVTARAVDRRTAELGTRPGLRELRRLTGERIGRRPSGTGWENKVRRLLTSHGLPEPVREYSVKGPDGSEIARVDLAYPEARLPIEYDGYETHGNRKAFVADRRRWNKLRDAGWPPLLVTDRDLKECPDVIVGHVRRALAQYRARG